MNRRSVSVAASSLELPSSHRLLWAIGASLILHAWLLGRPFPAPHSGAVKPRLVARLLAAVKPAPPGSPKAGRASRSSAVPEPSRARRGAVLSHATPDLAERAAPVVDKAPIIEKAPALPDGRELAARALGSVGAVTREMSRQEGRLDPLRGARPLPDAAKVRSAIADALEKQFGHPVHFVEESMGKGSDGARTYTIRTEKGTSCFKTLPDNVLLSAPGQGFKGAWIFPTPC
ncbi:hypothetical protein [Niveibacterium terrae]|uniref:hypothetical protein n=1 Tax=Niveibacterium terrae TaxID=3373598 RepID=UPI003A8FE9F4